jgi:undecaprenyl-phosphate 4-deoxy-4-formamido-L-arabinose transferase
MSTQGVDWELILVDDGSSDQSWQKITELASINPKIRGIRLSKNFGQHAALLAGIRAAKLLVTVTMDDDLQHRPDSIKDLLSHLDQNTSLVYGVAIAEEHNKLRNLSSQISKWFLSKVLGMRQAANASAFRAFATDLRESWFGISDTRISIDVLLSWSTSSYELVNVQMDKRAVGRSNYTFNKLLKHLFNIILGFSTRPLTLITIAGCALGGLGLTIMCWVLLRYFFGSSSVEGFTFLASLIALLGGMQLVGLGIIGQYLGRVFERSIGKPVYQVKSLTSDHG